MTQGRTLLCLNTESSTIFVCVGQWPRYDGSLETLKVRSIGGCAGWFINWLWIPQPPDGCTIVQHPLERRAKPSKRINDRMRSVEGIQVLNNMPYQRVRRKSDIDLISGRVFDGAEHISRGVVWKFGMPSTQGVKQSAK